MVSNLFAASEQLEQLEKGKDNINFELNYKVQSFMWVLFSGQDFFALQAKNPLPHNSNLTDPKNLKES